MPKTEPSNKIMQNNDSRTCVNGKRWDVQLDFVRQFKTDYVQQLERLVFEKKKS